MKALAEGLPVLYNHVVKEVKYDQQGVTVTAGNTVISGEYAWSGPLIAVCIVALHTATLLLSGMPIDLYSDCLMMHCEGHPAVTTWHPKAWRVILSQCGCQLSATDAALQSCS